MSVKHDTHTIHTGGENALKLPPIALMPFYTLHVVGLPYMHKLRSDE